MTVPAQVSEACAAFTFADEVHGAETSGSGHIHESWRITCGRAPETKRYLLQRLNTSVFPDPLALCANLTVVLPALRCPPVVVLDRDGSPLWRSPGGNYWRAFDFVEGTVAIETVTSPAVAAELGRAFGAFHADTAALNPDRLAVTLPGFHDPIARRRQLDAVVALDPSHRVAQSGAALTLLASLDHLGEQGQAMSARSLPRRVAHFDAKPANVLLDARSGKARCVVDLDTVMPGSWLWDIGDLVRSGTCRLPEDSVDLDGVGIDLTLYGAVLSGYLEEAGALLSPEEHAGVADAGLVVTYEQAVRFLTDHLAGDVYYRVDRPGHNLDRFANQIRLLQSMLESRSAMIER